MPVIKTIQEFEDVIPFHKHDGIDGSAPVDFMNIDNKEEGGKYAGTVRKTNSFSTTSTSYADVTDLSITVSTPESRRYLLICSGTIWNVTADKTTYLTFDIDGSNTGDLLEYYIESVTTAAYHSFSIHYITDKLATTAHTFKVRMKVSGGTGYLRPTIIFSAIELV